LINSLHALFHRPHDGWDPVRREYAETYAARECGNVDVALIDQLEQWIGGLRDKRVLDLGGGPGQYSVAFAQRGALVTWHDVSRNYLRIARQHADRAGIELQFSLGYLDDAGTLGDHPFDLVFNRVCWYYCKNDRSFAKLVYALIKPGGAGYIDTHPAEVEERHGASRVAHFFNHWLAWKIGHPFPPHGRVARLFQQYPIDYMILDYTSARNDRVFFQKSRVP